MAKRTQEGAGPGAGEPGADRGGSPQPGPAARNQGRQRRYTPEQKRAHLEAFAKSGMSAKDYCRTMGLGADSLFRWRRLYEEEGPKGLEPRRWGRPPGTGRGSKLPEPVQAAIQDTKARFPDFGFRKVRDYLRRFLHVKVSEGGVATVVKAMDLPPAAPPRRRKRRSQEPRRFERAKPGQLWQSDITSYMLGRHHRRVYLTVFLDDHSRYVVSWNLQLHQRQELVSECLLEGIQRFGKPRAVLTDQGTQYHAWHGKSAFDRLLEKEGIQHSVARTHHPQTVGKCERLWKTVGEELIDRAHPEDLEETRARLGHFFKHYNHFRPHQGIDGMTPADRFFGVEDQVRREVEGAQAQNALRLALGEKPQVRDYFVGSRDGQPINVRVDKDGIHIESANPGATGGKDEGHDDGDAGEADAEVREEDAVCDAAAAGGGGAGTVGGGAAGGEDEGARDGGGDASLLAGEDDEDGGGDGPEGDGTSPVAAEPDGGLGDGGGAAQAAAEEEGQAAVGGGDASQARGAAGEGAGGDAGAGEDPRADARPQGPGNYPCATAEAEETGSETSCGTTPGNCGGSGA